MHWCRSTSVSENERSGVLEPHQGSTRARKGIIRGPTSDSGSFLQWHTSSGQATHHSVSVLLGWSRPGPGAAERYVCCGATRCIRRLVSTQMLAGIDENRIDMLDACISFSRLSCLFICCSVCVRHLTLFTRKTRPWGMLRDLALSKSKVQIRRYFVATDQE